MNSENNEEKIDPKVVITCVILISIGMILGGSYLLYSEITEAKQGCNELDGDYDFKYFSGHLCNNKTFIKFQQCQYNSCETFWNFESYGEINMSKLFG